ncbi:hypothetical protein CYLTODRAFT_446430 [Cylindrobasidium torrendii FP15055 ss-10]|uniref:Uncharacterized protein n=1 Tax=Cylindrobasidium torrendii FP15055 ss-10 TaxID=1314674 RepID=A0A0D7AZF0_9AGAR|nr:hypothetical protein CYLTODRAFT_446430 [Cylindrobasidium torrendii FP15055 ss-10]
MSGYPTLFNSRLHTKEDLIEALDAVSEQLAQGSLSAKPLILVSAGGFPALMHLGTREGTRSIDYALANDATQDDVAQLNEAIGQVAAAYHWQDTFMDDKLQSFVPYPSHSWIQAAKRQNMVLYESAHLRIYAAPLEWSIASKLQRMSTSNPAVELVSRRRSSGSSMGAEGTREHDLTDITAMLHAHLAQRNWIGRMKGLTRDEIRGWSKEGSPIFEKTLDEVKDQYDATYGAMPFQ